jgi:DNA-binding response OmpR family regulator
MHRHRVLIVEGDPAGCAKVGHIFSRMGWLVRMATTAAEALEWLDAGYEPCCLVLDLVLPDGRGEDVLAKAREAGMRANVAVLTGVTDRARLDGVEFMKPEVILTKPVTPAEILDAVCPLTDAHSSGERPTIPGKGTTDLGPGILPKVP